MMLGLALALGARHHGAGDPPVITRVTPAVVGPYVDGDLPTDAYVPGTYDSTAGDIDSVGTAWTINGVAWDEVSALAEGDSVTLVETPVDDASPPNSRPFNYGPVTVAEAPPGGFDGWAAFDEAATDESVNFYTVTDGGQTFRVAEVPVSAQVIFSAPGEIDHALPAGGTSGSSGNNFQRVAGSGAGGFRKNVAGEAGNNDSRITVEAAAYTFTVGAAGLAPTTQQLGNRGGVSSIVGPEVSVTSEAGGPGGVQGISSSVEDFNGASGGGVRSGTNPPSTGAGIDGQGHRGGEGISVAATGAGGASEPGEDTAEDVETRGGEGILSSISGTPIRFCSGSGGMFRTDNLSRRADGGEGAGNQSSRHATTPGSAGAAGGWDYADERRPGDGADAVIYVRVRTA